MMARNLASPTYTCTECGLTLTVQNRSRHFRTKHPTVELTPLRPKLTPTERFWPNVKEAPDGCWLWMSKTDRDGYGYLTIDRAKVLAHRFAYTEIVGEIPVGLQLDHLCRVRNCVNPLHLEPVTSLENWRRGQGLSAINARKTHCKNGHAFDEPNTYRPPAGGRVCRTCYRTWAAERKASRAPAARTVEVSHG